MIKQLFKSLLLMMMISPLASLGMEKEQDKIELGKQLALAADQCDWAIVENLIAKGADVNQTFQEWTPLMNAASQDKEKIAQLLIDAGADLNVQNKYGSTALKIAAGWKNFQVHYYVDPICHMIIDAMLAQNEQQKERIYTTLLCIKQMPGFTRNLTRDLFKSVLLPMLTDVRQEINRIENVAIKTHLLEKYGFQPSTNPEPQQ